MNRVVNGKTAGNYRLLVMVSGCFAVYNTVHELPTTTLSSIFDKFAG
jgi:hypothetical protein